MQTSFDLPQPSSPPRRSAAADSGTLPCTPESLLATINAFDHWLVSNGESSFDPYDIWGTRYGRKARRLYYDKHPLGLPMVAPLLFLEIVFPRWRKAVVTPERFATADAQLLLAYLNLFRSSANRRHLFKARRLGKELLGYSVLGYSGLCWGYPFDWENQRGMWGRNTPFITCTPYCYEAYCALAEGTGDREALNSAASIASFVFHDLHDSPAGPGAAAASYSPHDDSHVVNASAYRAWVLYDSAQRFGRPDYLEKAEANLKFILQSQQPDGSWFYAVDSAGSFIDHFHTCFVLKNLLKIASLEKRPDLEAAVRRGYNFYRDQLFDADGLPKSFAIRPRLGIVRFEMYDFAEAITLGTLLQKQIPEAYQHAQQLAEVVRRDYQLPDGHFVTRVYIGGVRHTLPFLRWPQSQLFLALTNLYASMTSARQPKPSIPVSKVPTTK